MRYCAYCGRVAHRCTCAQPDSLLQLFLARRPLAFQAHWRDRPYKRGVPPQVKQAQRALLRKHYAVWMQEIIAQEGAVCGHCGAQPPLVLDHIVPIAKGGISAPDNLQLLCPICNRLKGKLWFDCRKAKQE